MPDLSIIDLITPYVLKGLDFGAWHPALAVLAVSEHESAVSAEGVVIRGIVHWHGDITPFFDPDRMVIGVTMQNEEGHPLNDAGRRSPWIDIRDSKLEFQLTVPRIPSQKVAGAVTAMGAPPPVAFQNTANVLNAYDNDPTDPLPSDYPATQFTLDFILTSIVLRPPFLRGAKRADDGQLLPDPENAEVKFTLPRIKVRLSQGSALADPLQVTLLSLGASGLDDPGDLGVAELVTMQPPYAFIGDSNVVGFGFRSAVLDLSANSTPPSVLEQFGYDDKWQGLYLPEIRLFVAPHGARDLAVEAGATNLLIGFGQTAGVTGDFLLQVLDQGAGPLQLNARFYDSTGQSYGINRLTATTGEVQLPEFTRMIADVEGGRAPFNVDVSIAGAGAQPGREHDVHLATGSFVDIVIHAVDHSNSPKEQTLTIRASRQSAPALPPAGTVVPGQIAPVDLTTTKVLQGTTVQVSAPRLRLVSETPATATIGIDAPGTPNWTVNQVAKGASQTITVDVAPGASVDIKAELDQEPGVQTFTAFYRFDHPKTGDPDYATVKTNSHTAAAPDDGPTTPWSAGTYSMDALGGLLQNASDTQQISIKGYASYEGNDTPQSVVYNTQLAQRRADGLKAMIRKLMEDGGPLHGKSFQFTPDPVADMSQWQSQGTTLETRREFWKAVATFPGGLTKDKITITGKVSRRPTQNKGGGGPVIPVPDSHPAAEPPSPPSWFISMGAKVRIVRNQFVACEVFGKFNIQTATENHLDSAPAPAGATVPQWKKLGNNPSDGIIDIRVVVQIDDATDTVTVTLLFGADPADKDGLALLGTRPGDPPQPESKGLNFFGATAVFYPLLAAASNAVAKDGALAEMAVTGGILVPIGVIAGLGWIRTERIIWYGGEAKVVANAKGDWVVTALFDVETAISANFLDIVVIPQDAPLVVRYKAIGLMFGAPPGQPKFQLRPVFDSSKGYTIDVSRPGAIKVKEPLGSILQILGARIAKNNPMIFEVDLGFAINLGVITVERAKVRATLYDDNAANPNNNLPLKVELTAFGASVNIPGAVRGNGYVEIGDDKFVGYIDITIIPVKVRIAAGVGVQQIDDGSGGHKTAVIVTLDVSFPVAIPLGGSGLGIYGFIGLFGMHWGRDESIIDADASAPALNWLQKTGGEPQKLQYWKAKLDSWAFGVGALLGTMGSSIVFNLKGLFLLELPGPRLLLMMKANLLIPMPPRTGPAEGLFFAVLDLDIGRGTLTIGVSVSFEVKYLLKIHIPVEAFFNFNKPKDWHLYLGQYSDMIQADILQVFEGSGYLMLSGDGLPKIGELPEIQSGFAIATGLHVSFIWGSKGAGLYAELAAGFDAIVGFDPFRFAGILYVRGTLHLWIIDISAWAKLTVDMGSDPDGKKISLISGEICGEVEFLFFTVSGCVDFALGEGKNIPAPPSLFKSLKLISRSPALVIGTGVDKAIDAAIGEGTADENDAKIPVVPIDTIPLAMMSAPPLYSGVQFKGSDLKGSPKGTSDGWVARGDTYFRYKLKTVTLSGSVTGGKTPATWWEPKSETAFDANLALLSWVPEATPKALEYSKHLEDWVKEHWGTVCLPAAPPAPIMWTFLQQPIGPSDVGWWLFGEAWPDPPNVVRSGPPNMWLKVHERWRSGNKKLDQLRGVVAAWVEAAPVNCPPTTTTPTTPPRLSAVTQRAIADRIDVIGVAAGRQTLDVIQMAPTSPLDIVKSLNRNTPLTRSALLGVTPTTASATATTGATTTPPPPTETPRCQSRVLAAPLFDDYWRATTPAGTQREKYIRDELAKRKYKPGPLIDAVVCRTDAVEYATFYLFVPRELLASKQLVIDVMNSNESVISERVLTSADAMPNVSFPATWTNMSGPWAAEIFRLQQHQQYLQQYGYLGVIVNVKGDRRGDRIEIGLKQTAINLLKGLTHRPFYVAAVEAVRSAEAIRFDFDTTEQNHKKEIAGANLSSDAEDYALLQPGQKYSVTLTWDADRERRPPKGDVSDQLSTPNQSATFWFQTDSNPPKRLDPWVLMTLPEQDEQHFFADDHLKLVFGTSNVVRIWDTYGKRLQIRLKAASFRPVPGTPTTPMPLKLDAGTVKPMSQDVLSPFEDALDLALQGSCVPVDKTRIRHSIVDMDSPLDTFTDYILDIEEADKAAPDDAAGRLVYRRSFSTGAFRSVQAFALSFFRERVKHRYIAPNVLQPIGNTFTASPAVGHEFDSALIAAGLEPPELPDRPRLVVYWQQTGGGDPQPAAVMIDSSEPLWRSRLVPKEISDPTPDGNKRYELAPVVWLHPDEEPGGNAIVDKIVAAPGNQRALVTLKTNSRGKHLKLALRKVALTQPYLDGSAAQDTFITIADLVLDRAPWEEVN